MGSGATKGGGTAPCKPLEDRKIKVAPKATAPPVPLPASPPGRIVLMSADVGGTSSRLHLFLPPDANEAAEAVVPPARILKVEKYRNASFESFADIVRTFLSEALLDAPPMLACLGVAGVVVDNAVRFVNLGWTVRGSELEQEFGIARVVLINDFEAQGYGLLTLDPLKDCEVLQRAEPLAGAPMALVGAGTGLGEAFLTTCENGDYDVWPSEGGHKEFAPRQDGSSNLQFEMLQFLQIKYSAKARISTERIISGKGIANIYEFLAWKFPERKNNAVHRRFLGGIGATTTFDPAVVVQAAAAGECDLCQQAMDMFIGAYGAEAGVVALKYMPFGGLFLTGGVTVKTKDFILGQRGLPDHFMEAFLDKGRISSMLERVPVYIVCEEDMGERGVRLKAMRLYQELGFLRRKSKGKMCLVSQDSSV